MQILRVIGRMLRFAWPIVFWVAVLTFVLYSALSWGL
jgi:hypothetical protein